MFKKLNIVLYISVIIIAGCNMFDTNPKEKTLALLERNLKIGDAEEKAVKFIKKQKWRYHYSEYLNAYEISDPFYDTKPYTGQIIYIYLDKDKRISKFEVRMVYTRI